MDDAGEASRVWRGRYWRERATTAFGLIGIAGIVLAYFVRELHFVLLAGAAVIGPAWLATQSWLGLYVRELYETSRAFWLGQLTTAVVVAIGFAASLFYRGRAADEGLLLFFVPFAIALLLRAIYLWRDLHGRAVGLFPAPASRTSPASIAVHLAGYAAAIVAGFVAAGYFEDWPQRMSAYAGAALLAKFVVDLLIAPPPPLPDASLSRALTRMTALSPLLWGLPWALLIVGYFVAMEGKGLPSWDRLVAEMLTTAVYLTTATTLIFAIATIVAFVLEPAADRKWAASEPVAEDELRPVDWAMLYWAALFLAIAALVLVFEPREPSDDEVFGVDKWTCAKKENVWTLARLSNGNFDIRIRGRHIDMFNVSCVPRKQGGGCEYGDEGWSEVEFVVLGADGFKTTVKFNRVQKGVNSSFRHHADVYDELANEILLALYNGKSVDVTVKGAKGRTLYTKRIDLTGYNKALDTCAAHWRREHRQQIQKQ